MSRDDDRMYPSEPAHMTSADTERRLYILGVRKMLKEQHRPIQGRLKCGAPFGTSIDTCPYCEPLRRELSERLQHDG